MKISCALSFLGLVTLIILAEGQDTWHVANKDHGHIDNGDNAVDFAESLLLQEESEDQWPQKPREACVTILFFEGNECSGDPVRSYSFTTWTKPGSPCGKF